MADAPVTPAPEATDTTSAPPAPPAEDLGDAGKRALEEERKARRDAEKQLKANQAELEEFRRKSMTDAEKAVAEARSAGLAEGITQGASRLVDAEIRGAAKGRIADVDALLEGLDRKTFLTEDGDADRDAIAKWIDRLAPPLQEQPPADPFAQPIDLGQGPRSAGTPPALGSNELLDTVKKMVGA